MEASPFMVLRILTQTFKNRKNIVYKKLHVYIWYPIPLDDIGLKEEIIKRFYVFKRFISDKRYIFLFEGIEE